MQKIIGLPKEEHSIGKPSGNRRTNIRKNQTDETNNEERQGGHEKPDRPHENVWKSENH